MGKASCEHIIPAEAEVMFEYIAVEDDELTLKVGDVITDIKKVRALLKECSAERIFSYPSHLQSDEGWYEGFLRGRRGVFPDNFVQIRPVKTILQPEIPKAVLPLEIPKAVVPEMRGTCKCLDSNIGDTFDCLNVLLHPTVDWYMYLYRATHKSKCTCPHGVG